MDRLQFNEILKDKLGNDHVYFQPPSNVQMQYPCIVYERAKADTRFAGDKPYRITTRYTVTVIDRNPDSLVPSAVALMPMCTHSAFFVADNLNHDVFDVYI